MFGTPDEKLALVFDLLHQTRETMFHHISNPNTEERVENTTRSGVFLTKFELFGNVIKHGLERLIYLPISKLKLRSKRRNKIVKIYAN